VRLATELVSDSLVLVLGGKEIRIQHLGRAHTGGDLAVYLPAERVLFLSEIYFNRLFPSMRTAYPTEWVGVIEKAQAMDADFYIPGHGFVDPPDVLEEELEAYKQATIAVIAETTRLHGTGVSADSALALADFGEFETWAGRDRQAERAVPRIYMELNGELR
jgi:glyoxylase-like metal-dependent hydrolase (beta-lactamase superfamily II)